MEWIEPVATAFGLAAVMLVVMQNIWCWPTGLIQVTLSIFVFFREKLYSDVILHMIYVGVQIYGWHHWLHGGADHGALSVSRLSLRALLGWIILTLGGTAGWGFFMATNTDAAFPYGDAFILVASLVAMWLQARKRIETWFFWIAVDVIAIGIYYLKGLAWFTGLYIVFLILCIVGVLSWQRSLNREDQPA